MARDKFVNACVGVAKMVGTDDKALPYVRETIELDYENIKRAAGNKNATVVVCSIISDADKIAKGKRKTPLIEDYEKFDPIVQAALKP